MRAFSIVLFATLADMSLQASTIHIPGDYDTIQEGTDAANEGDTVLVKPGFYEENITIDVARLVLASLFLTSGDTSYISSTIIDGHAEGSVIISDTGYDTTAAIIGFTIQNGYSEAGGGILCTASSPRIMNNIITQNTAIDNGGGICCYLFADAIIRNNMISGNIVPAEEPTSGGGIYCLDSDPEISHNHIIDNEACWGGGIGAERASELVIENNVIANNTADP